jgi:hypothetical protein
MDPKNKFPFKMDSPLFVTFTFMYYWMGIGKFFHVTNICPNIAYYVNVVTKCFFKANLKLVILIFHY